MFFNHCIGITFRAMRNTTLAAIILVGGSLLFLASPVHWFMGNKMLGDKLLATNTSAEVIDSVQWIWNFLSISMALLGIWGMFIAVSARKNLRYVRKQALSLGSGLVLFGTWGAFKPFFNPHLAFFALVGLMILIPGFFLSKEQGPYK